MESIAELKNICQATAKRDKSNVYMRYVCRNLSIHLTRLLLPTPVTADQVSQAMIAMGIFAPLVLLLPWKGSFLLGALLLQVWYLLDCMDGEVARYRHYQQTGRIAIDKREASLTGMYYDMINHYLVNFLVPLCAAFGLYAKTAASGWILLGMAGALGQVLLLAMHDARSRAVLAHLKKYAVIRPVQPAGTADAGPKSRPAAHRAFAALHYAMTYPSVMNLVLAAALLNAVWPVCDWRAPLVLFLGLGSVIVSAVLIVRAIRNRAPDAELRNEFQVE